MVLPSSHRRAARRIKTAGALCAVASLLLSGCTAALDPLEPAAPNDDAPAGQSAPAHSAVFGSNPYEAGATRGWSVKLATAPSFVSYTEDTHTLLIATDGVGTLRGAQLQAYSVVGGGEVLEQWRAELPDAKNVTALAVNADSIYVNTMSAAGEQDFLVVNAKTGEVRQQWLRHPQPDAEVPQIVGNYAEGVGVLKRSASRLTAALLDKTGETSKAQELDEAAAARVISRNLVDTGLPAYADLARSNIIAAGTATEFVIYPELAVITGDDCYSAADGFVCVTFTAPRAAEDAGESQPEGDGDSADSPQTAASAEAESQAASDDAAKVAQAAIVTEFDTHAHLMRETAANATSMATNVIVAGMNPDITARELGDALLKKYGANTGEERLAAIVYDGEWLPKNEWKSLAGADMAPARALARQAPFYQLPTGEIVNAATGNPLTAPGAIGYVGVDASAAHMFEYADGTLFYLNPVGKVSK